MMPNSVKQCLTKQLFGDATDVNLQKFICNKLVNNVILFNTRIFQVLRTYGSLNTKTILKKHSYALFLSRLLNL